MSKTVHTPGPWLAAASPSSIVGWPIVGQQGRAICAITWPRHMARTAVSEEFFQECAANARLIAAAPDLLEALRAMVARWEPEPDGYADRRMWEAACEAIAKATHEPDTRGEARRPSLSKGERG